MNQVTTPRKTAAEMETERENDKKLTIFRKRKSRETTENKESKLSGFIRLSGKI